MEPIDRISQHAVEAYVANVDGCENGSVWFSKRLVLINTGKNQYLDCCYSCVFPIRWLWATIFENGVSTYLPDVAIFLGDKEYKNDRFRDIFTHYYENNAWERSEIVNKKTDSQLEKMMNVLSITPLPTAKIGFLREYWFASHLKTIQTLSAEEREWIFEIEAHSTKYDILQHIRQAAQGNERGDCVNAFKLLSDAQKNGVIKDIGTVVKSWHNDIKDIRDIPWGQKELVVQYFLLVLEHMDTTHKAIFTRHGIGYILQALRDTSTSEWGNVITHIKSFELFNVTGQEAKELLTTIANIPQARREFVIKYPHVFGMKDMSPQQQTKHFITSGKEIISFFKQIHEIADEELEAIIALTKNAFPMKIKDIALLFTLIWKMPREKRELFIAFINECKMEPIKKGHLLSELDNIPQEEWDDYLKNLKSLLHLLPEFSGNPFFFLYLLPSGALRTEERLRNCKTDPEYIVTLRASIEQKLASNSTPPQLLARTAQYVYDNQDFLQLAEEEPLFQQALAVLIVKTMEGEKNPFSLYKKLQRLAKELPDDLSQETGFCISKLQASARAFQIARSELPQDATHDAWNQLIIGLKTKVESNEQVQDALKAYFDVTWKSLWDNSLSDYYFSSLLKITEGKVSIVEAQFRALLHYILSKEKEVRGLFSEQEELLIKLAMSIQHCTGGKKEGIALSFQQLDTSFKYRSKGLEEGYPEEIQAKEFVAKVLQKALSDQFSGTNALMLELTGQQVVNQAAHQALYLKNLIGPLVGLNHDLTFDTHTGALYDSLLVKSRLEALQIFFRHFTPRSAAQELMRVVNSDFRKNCNIIRHIMQEGMEDGWDWHEETLSPIRLNEHGAFAILKATGYLT